MYARVLLQFDVLVSKSKVSILHSIFLYLSMIYVSSQFLVSNDQCLYQQVILLRSRVFEVLLLLMISSAC